MKTDVSDAFLGLAIGIFRKQKALGERAMAQLSDDDLRAAGLTPGTLRVSIGLEDADDLVADLTAAAAG